MNEAALILFTLTAEAEAARKRLGDRARTRAIFASLIAHLGDACDDVHGLDLLVASPQPTGLLSATHLPQRGDTFGQSLRMAVDDAFAMGYRRVLVVGNDSPEITPEYLREAILRLDRGGPSSAVLGPTHDGGYALLGLLAPCPAAFQGIRFGSSSVAETTEQRLSAAGLRVSRMRSLGDIDDFRSLRQVLGQMQRAVMRHHVQHTGRTAAFTLLLRQLRVLLEPESLATATPTTTPAGITHRRTIRMRAPPQAA